MDTIIITGHNLTIHDVYHVAYHNTKVELSAESRDKITNSRKIVDKVTSEHKIIYGITTGFGSLSENVINTNETEQLSRNLIRSHAISVDQPLDQPIVRAAILVRINALASGYSGIKLETVEALINLLNYNITPCVPRYGSLACSGDLCLLSFVAIAISEPISDDDTDDIECFYNGQKYTSKIAFEMNEINKVRLSSKEGLALTNGSTFTAGLAALNCYFAEKLYYSVVGSCALMMESLNGVTNAYQPQIHKLRGHFGQIHFAKSIISLTQNSEFLNSGRVQDAYSLRCAPQLHGTFLDTLEHCKEVITLEINATTDNPLVFSEDEIYSGGNFHGEPIAVVMDFLKIVMCETVHMSERRQFRILSSQISGWKKQGINYDMLTPDAGLNSGYMITQYTSASLVHRCQKMAIPDSLYSNPTCENQEDHNSNGWNGTLDCHEMIKICRHIIAFEYLLATRGIWLLKQTDKYMNRQLGIWSDSAYQKLLPLISQSSCDHFIGKEHENVRSIVYDTDFLDSIIEISPIL